MVELKLFSTLLILSLFSHYFGDFEFQTDSMRKLKHQSVYWLLLHALTYTVTMLLFFPFVAISGISTLILFKYIIAVGCTHFLIDFVTSKVTHHLYERNRINELFNVVGLDQIFHVISMIYFIYLFFF